MAEIILNTGEVLEVSYNQAAKVYQILIGNKEPADEAQAEFMTTVADVKFPRTLQRNEIDKETDEDLKTLMGMQYRDGYSKFHTIGQHLKKKRGIV